MHFSFVTLLDNEQKDDEPNGTVHRENELETTVKEVAEDMHEDQDNGNKKCKKKECKFFY